MKLPLTSRIVLYFALMAAVLLATVGVLSYRSGSENLKAAAISEMLTKAIEKEAALDTWLDERLDDIGRLANQADLVEKATNLIAAAPASEEARTAHAVLLGELEPHLTGRSAYSEVFVMEPEGGKVVASTSPAQEGKSKSGLPYFDNGKTDFYLQPPYNSVDLNAPAMTVAIPLRATNGRVVAVLAVRLDLATMNTIVQRRTGLRQTEDAFLINAEQFLVTQPRFIREPVVLSRKLETEAVRRCAARNSGVVLTPDYRGVPSIAVYRWNAKRQLGLIVKIDQTEALAPARAFGRSVVLISSLALLVTVGLAFLLARTITQPLHTLQAGVRRFAEGNIEEPLLESSGDEVGLLAHEFNQMAAGVTERTAALATSNVALNESQALYQSLVEHMPAGVFRKDREGRYVFVNSWFCRLKEMKAEEILGKTPRELAVYEESAAEAGAPSEMLNSQRTLAMQGTDNHKTIMRTGKPIKVEEVYPQPDGTMQHLQVVKSPVFAVDGTIIGTQGIIFDVTDRKRLETQLLQSQKMETVGKLAGGIAHEFNSILTAIIGQSELLLGDLPAGSPLAKSATEISKAAGRAATLTRQLLAYGRKQILQPETLDLNRVIASMEGMFHHLMGGDVDTQIIPAPGLQAVLADAGQIEQVIMNMVINARDAMPNGGKLTLETANVSFDQESVGRYPELKTGDYVMLAITDTGMGMSEEVKARLFEPFFSTKGVGQGTGLGLSTCYGIIKQSGGHISVYSELARGATFKIYLPQVEQQTKIPLQRLDSLELPRGTETILLVEDDPALREMAAMLLRRLGYTVLAAANGIEALSLKQQRATGHIDLLFTDVVMPHMSGKELSERVRVLSPHTRILFTSAYTENAIVHQGVLNQDVAFLQKPFTPSALAHKVREILDSGKA